MKGFQEPLPGDAGALQAFCNSPGDSDAMWNVCQGHGASGSCGELVLETLPSTHSRLAGGKQACTVSCVVCTDSSGTAWCSCPCRSPSPQMPAQDQREEFDFVEILIVQIMLRMSTLMQLLVLIIF